VGAAVSTELEPGETRIRRTTTTDYEGRAAWLPWLVALLLVPPLLAALGLLWPRPGVERDLTARSAAALAAGGFASAAVSFDGRDAAVTGVPAGAEQRALDVVSRVDGVRVARIGTGAAVRTETVDVTLAGNQVVLQGKVPDEATKRAVLDAAEAEAGGRQVVDQLTVQSGSVLPGDVARIGDLVGALGGGGGERSISWGSNGVTLSGSVPSEGARAAAEAAVRGALGSDVPVDNRLMVTAGGPLSLQLQDGRLVVSGEVPDEATRRAVLSAVQAAGRPVVDELSVRPSAAMPGEAATAGALADVLVGALGAGSLVWDGNGVALSGTVSDAAAKTAAERAVLSALPGADVDNRLTISGPPRVDRAAVQGALDALLAGSAISFLPDSAQLTAQGAETVRRVVELLRGTPGVRVEIGGHVAVGPGGAENALRLSEARAVTVRDAFVAAGIPAESLTPRGYGDTRPKPDPAASRRVEITVL